MSKFHIRLLETRPRPPYLNNVAALPCEKQLICRQYTKHINRLLSEPPTYYWGRLL